MKNFFFNKDLYNFLQSTQDESPIFCGCIAIYFLPLLERFNFFKTRIQNLFPLIRIWQYQESDDDYYENLDLQELIAKTLKLIDNRPPIRSYNEEFLVIMKNLREEEWKEHSSEKFRPQFGDYYEE